MGKKVCQVLLVLYTFVMLVLLFGRSLPPLQQPYWALVKDSFNLQPLRTIGNYWDILARPEYYLGKWDAAAYAIQQRHAIVNLAGNVVMFLPLGFLPPLCFPSLRKWWRMLLLALVTLTAIELAQAFSLRGTCDVDDLILNMAGAAIGFCFCQLLLLHEKTSGSN